tara:strand:- start:302 stop:577 length:276 start_codon:yes stop_codon:yes gene_type:complete
MITELKTWIENYNKTTFGKVFGKVVKLKDVPYDSPIHLITKKNTLYVYSNGYVKTYRVMDSINGDNLIQIYNVNSLLGKEIDENTDVFLCD